MDATAFALLVTQVAGVNVVLSADNAVVIALAARGLPSVGRKQAIVFGSAAAVVLRIVLTIAALELLRLPYLKIAGAAVLLWIAVKLLRSSGDDAHEVRPGATVASAIAAILLADLVMSLDNVLAVAAAAKDSIAALVAGLALSIPLVVLASTVLVRFMQRWPVIVTLGAALIGWVAGGLAVTEALARGWIDASAPALGWIVPAAAALGVVAVGKGLAAPAGGART